MLWDNFRINPVFTKNPKLSIIFTESNDLYEKIKGHLCFAGVDLQIASEFFDPLEAIKNIKPEIVYVDNQIIASNPCLFPEIKKFYSKYKLPIMLVSDTPPKESSIEEIHYNSSVNEVFLKTRALLRNFRPSAPDAGRKYGQVFLNEEKFSLSMCDKLIYLNRTEFCILGVFFDVLDGKIDREVLQVLLSKSHQVTNSGRNFDAQISRVRRSVKKKLGQDPLVTIRGYGYALRF